MVALPYRSAWRLTCSSRLDLVRTGPHRRQSLLATERQTLACFRFVVGVDALAHLCDRSSTLHKQAAALFDALCVLLTWIPFFGSFTLTVTTTPL